MRGGGAQETETGRRGHRRQRQVVCVWRGGGAGDRDGGWGWGGGNNGDRGRRCVGGGAEGAHSRQRYVV